MNQIIFNLNQLGTNTSYYLDLEKSHKFRKIFFLINTLLFLILTFIAIYVNKTSAGQDYILGSFLLHGSSHRVRILQALGGIIFVYLPLILERLFKVRLSVLNILLYEIYLFISLGIGSILEGFSSIKSYDDLSHFFAGAMGSIVGISIWLNSIEKAKTTKKGKPLIGMAYAFALFMVGFFGIIWEMWEYLVDTFLPERDCQRTHFPDGSPKLGRDAIWDTMKDMTVNILGAIFGIFLAWIINRTCKGNYDRQLLIFPDPRKVENA